MFRFLGLHRLPIVRFFWIRNRTCWRKYRHRSESAATTEARRLGRGLHAYRCPYCRKWHVGHAERKRY